jgi:organic radical activating enzyme
MKCDFCLFHKLKYNEIIEHEYIKKITKILKLEKKQVHLKITGGEPLLKVNLIIKILKLSNIYENIMEIGIGTNGTIIIPDTFNIVKHPLMIYFSRHTINNNIEISNICKNIHNPLIQIRLNCNLIKGYVDDEIGILKYLDWAKKQNIEYVCFRELNSLDIDTTNMYPHYIYDYDKYYKKNIISIEIRHTISKLIYNFSIVRPHDENHFYTYNGMKISFRIVKEHKIREYNLKNKDIDEYVIHPDGLITGCWDRELKILNI